MAVSLGTMVLKITVNSSAALKGLNSFSNTLVNLSANFGKNLFSVPLDFLGKIGLAAQGVATIFQTLKELISTPLSLAGDIEQAEVAFGTFLGNAQAGVKMVADLRDFALRTPFSPVEVIKSAEKMMAFGIPEDKLLATMEVLGDLALGDTERLEGLALVMGQVAALGKLQAQDTNQFAARGVNVIDALAKSMGKPREEILALRKDGLISYNDVAKALQGLTREGGKFHNAMSNQLKTLKGKWGVFAETVQFVLAGIGDAMVSGFSLKDLLDRFVGMAQTVREKTAEYLTPIFTQLGSLFKTVWNTLGHAWDTIGKPVFIAVKNWIASLIPEGMNLGEVWLAAMQYAANGVGYLIDSLKILSGAVVMYVVAPIRHAAVVIADEMAYVVDFFILNLDAMIQAVSGDAMAGFTEGLMRTIVTLGQLIDFMVIKPIMQLIESLKLLLPSNLFGEVSGDPKSDWAKKILEANKAIHGMRDELAKGNDAWKKFGQGLFDAKLGDHKKKIDEWFDAVRARMNQPIFADIVPRVRVPDIFDQDKPTSVEAKNEIKLAAAMLRGSKEAESILSKFQSGRLAEQNAAVIAQRKANDLLDKILKEIQGAAGLFGVAGF